MTWPWLSLPPSSRKCTYCRSPLPPKKLLHSPPMEKAPSQPPKLGQMEGEVSPTLRSKAKYTGKVCLCTARYSYNPYDGPNEHPEAELPLVAGKYLYVYGTMDDDGFYEDGQVAWLPSSHRFLEDIYVTPRLPHPAGAGAQRVHRWAIKPAILFQASVCALQVQVSVVHV
ncbi:hypothetical protein SKAU_G00279570 [Synaphobranchus kaupii]|uniref:Uncharacterized protein n=1 Tax=Synaphobranchus kaupii TaxID=118154 RepID=A0A9Q1INJ7_SYNKA|nr:hypothetical protein SKAU_G00279570 [Synaphobranchus kaupii]